MTRLLAAATTAVIAMLLSISARAADGAVRIATLNGFDLPETVQYDAAQDVYFVSNMVGVVTDKDNNGIISRIDARTPDRHTPFIVGGKNGVVLHGPKGMVCHGNVLWVADIDAIRAFDTRTGEPLRSIDLEPAGAVSLNDVTRHPDGTLYVTDPRFLFTTRSSRHVGVDRVFRVAPSGRIDVILQGDGLQYPNGIEWDPRGRRLLIAPLADGADLLAWQRGEPDTRHVASGPGSYDGLEVDPHGRIFVSSLDSGAIFEISAGRMRAVVENLPSPGNFAWDAGRQRLIVPLIQAGQVEIRQLRQDP